MPTMQDLATARGLPLFALDRSVTLNCGPDTSDTFYPEHGKGFRELRGAAKRRCVPCPARTACLKWALETRQAFGIWGGYTASERADLLKQYPHLGGPQ